MRGADLVSKAFGTWTVFTAMYSYNAGPEGMEEPSTSGQSA